MSDYPPIQIVDKDDKPLHGTDMHTAYQQGLIFRVVYVIVEDKDGRILLQRRAANVATFPNCWDVSAAGHVDEGENYETAALRELQEELGISGVKLKEVDYFYTESRDNGSIRNRFSRVYKVVVPGYIRLVPAPEEISEVRWLKHSEIKDFLSDNAQAIADGLRNTLERHSAIWKSLA